MKLDFENSGQITDFTTVPAGAYLCRIAEVRDRQSRAGDTMWSIRLVVTEGEFTGRMAAWDNLVFSNRGLNRVKSILVALGLPSDGTVDLNPEDLMEKEVFVEVRPADYHSPEGVMTRRNEIPYDGYRALARKQDPETKSGSRGRVDEDMPF